VIASAPKTGVTVDLPSIYRRSTVDLPSIYRRGFGCFRCWFIHAPSSGVSWLLIIVVVIVIVIITVVVMILVMVIVSIIVIIMPSSL
jgi:hypothetical protein